MIISLGGGIWKTKKGGGSTVQGQVFLKGGGGGGGGGAGTFPIFQIIFQDLSFLHLEITLLFAKLCYQFEEKPVSWKKSF